MTEKVSRREWLAAALCLPSLSIVRPAAPAWNHPVALGRTGLRVTPLGMGCEEAAVPALVRQAADLGINHFNLFAPAGNLTPLHVMGEGLKPVRQRVVIAVDADGQLRARRRAAGVPGEVAPPGERTRQAVLADLDAQLNALGTDYVDLWYLTSKRRPEEISDDLLEAVRVAKQAGKIRAAATSTHSFAAIVPRVLEAREALGAVMVTCNVATWPDVSADVARLREAGVGIVAMKPLMGGLPDGPAVKRPWIATPDTGSRREAALAAALKWVLSNPQVDTAPVLMRDIGELRRNVRAASAPLAASDAELLVAAAAEIRPFYCRNCGACDGSCRHGLPINDMLRALMYAEGYGNLARARSEFRQAPASLTRVRCASCEGCTVCCPHGVQVVDQLTRAQGLLA